VATTDSSRVRARFDRFTVDLSTGELIRSGTKIPIQEKPLQVLRLLLESEGDVVSRDHLRSALWAEDTFVDFEHGVNTAVKKLRHALEDSADNPRFVETLPRFGYRFIVPVEWITNGNGSRSPTAATPSTPPGAAASPPAARNRRRQWTSALVLVVLSLVFVAVLLSDRLGFIRSFREVVEERHAAAQVALSQRRLTANPDDRPLSAGVISPDGKYLAYTDPSGFYLKLIDGGETHRVPLPKGFEPMPESWFPDSVHLVVCVMSGKSPPSLWKISVLGGTPRKLADLGSSARVSPDGTKIAYLVGIWDKEQIWLMDADGSGVRKLIDGGVEGFGAVTWAPDGKRFAYVRTQDAFHNSSKQMEAYDLASGQSSVMLSDDRLGDEIAWIHDDRLIYCLHDPEPNWQDLNLWSTQLDPNTKLPSGSPIRVTNGRDSVVGISKTADSKRLAVRRLTFQPDVFLTDVDARGKRLSAPRRFTFDDRWDWPSAWTPDSKAVIFSSEREGSPHIYTQRIDETQPELLVGAPGVSWVGRLTPDGSHVLYAVGASPGEPADKVRLMQAPLAGGPARMVLEGSNIIEYQCARLPSLICLYMQTEPKSEYHRFFAFDPAGASPPWELPVKVKKEDGPNQWGLSPDGKYLVMRKTQDPYQTPTMRIFNVATGAERDISLPGVGLIMGMDWAIDSKTIWVSAYMGRGAYGDRSALLTVELSGKSRVLMERQNMGLWFAIPSPDGQHLALLGHTKSSNISLLEDF
jgi:DNA-binding winged helix-turn-helix (wHTH) protein/Tol biopolymer transport system component